MPEKQTRKPDPRAKHLAKLAAAAARLGVTLPRVIRPGGWTPKELAALGTGHDEVIAAKIGRSVGAVRTKRADLKIPVFRDRRGRKPAG